MSFLRYVHPFYDGNGRTVRTFINLELARANYPMIGLKYSDEDKYYRAFELPDEEGYRFMEELIYTNVERELSRLLLLKTGN